MNPDCWSTDGEMFDHDYSSIIDQLEVGQTIYEGNSLYCAESDLFDVESILEDIQSNAYDLVGESSDGYTDSINQDAKNELNTFIESWLSKHAPIKFYKVRNVSERVITEDDKE